MFQMNTYKTTDNRAEYLRSERRIRNNRIRRQREMRKNFLLVFMTLCLIVTCSISLNTINASAIDDSVKPAYKYYKSIYIENRDTLWSIATQYMDDEHYSSTGDYINEVKQLNSLSGDEIHYGEYLIVPYYDNTFVG